MPHPLHITISNIEYIEKESLFEINIKIFKDDFQSIVFQETGILILKDNNLDTTKINQINTYINKHFCIIFDGKKNQLNFISAEDKEDAIWIKYNIKQEIMHNILITNTLLTNLYTDQKNLVIFNYKDIKKGITLNANDTSYTINL